MFVDGRIHGLGGYTFAGVIVGVTAVSERTIHTDAVLCLSALVQRSNHKGQCKERIIKGIVRLLDIVFSLSAQSPSHHECGEWFGENAIVQKDIYEPATKWLSMAKCSKVPGSSI